MAVLDDEEAEAEKLIAQLLPDERARLAKAAARLAELCEADYPGPAENDHEQSAQFRYLGIRSSSRAGGTRREQHRGEARVVRERRNWPRLARTWLEGKRINTKSVIESMGYQATSHGGVTALGSENGRGGVNAAHFTGERAKNVVRCLVNAGVPAFARPSGSPKKFVVLTS